MMLRGLLACLAASAMACGCSKTITPDDGSVTDSGVADAGVPDAYDPRFPGADTCQVSEWREGECGCIGTSLRCDTCADVGCPSLTDCSSLAPICVGSTSATFDDGCSFSLVGDGQRGYFCASGDPCLVRRSQDGTESNRWEGKCLDVSTCLGLETADPPVGEISGVCRWSNGEEVAAAPPEQECPASEAPFVFCGGSCGDALCPEFDAGIGARPRMSCVGVSSERGFGICAPGNDYCHADDMFLNELLIDGFALTEEIPFACIVMEASTGIGYPVGLDACHAYAATHDGVRCVDAAWNEI